ncbi:MAG: hypothetical protein KF832_19605 [Caldilineaceae bacterium]|nr:hypothetical protein [Caldilineaceae bacterium]
MMTLPRAGARWKRPYKQLLQRWQRLLLGFYVALFALVLPLICWGALVEPGHPHRLPHFVFASPVLSQKLSTGTTPPPAAVDHTAMPHGMPHALVHGQPTGATVDEAALRVCGLLTDATIPGRSAPMFVAFSLLLLVFFAVGALGPRDLPHFVIWQRLQLPQPRYLPVPFPPPRFFAH